MNTNVCFHVKQTCLKMKRTGTYKKSQDTNRRCIYCKLQNSLSTWYTKKLFTFTRNLGDLIHPKLDTRNRMDKTFPVKLRILRRSQSHHETKAQCRFSSTPSESPRFETTQQVFCLIKQFCWYFTWETKAIGDDKAIWNRPEVESGV